MCREPAVSELTAGETNIVPFQVRVCDLVMGRSYALYDLTAPMVQNRTAGAVCFMKSGIFPCDYLIFLYNGGKI